MSLVCGLTVTTGSSWAWAALCSLLHKHTVKVKSMPDRQTKGERKDRYYAQMGNGGIKSFLCHFPQERTWTQMWKVQIQNLIQTALCFQPAAAVSVLKIDFNRFFKWMRNGTSIVTKPDILNTALKCFSLVLTGARWHCFPSPKSSTYLGFRDFY